MPRYITINVTPKRKVHIAAILSAMEKYPGVPARQRDICEQLRNTPSDCSPGNLSNVLYQMVKLGLINRELFLVKSSRKGSPDVQRVYYTLSSMGHKATFPNGERILVVTDSAPDSPSGDITRPEFLFIYQTKDRGQTLSQRRYNNERFNLTTTNV